MPDAKSQGGAIRKAQAGSAVEREISATFVAIVDEVKGSTGFAEHRPMRAQPEVPLHDNWDPSIVSGPIRAEAEPDAVVDRVDEALRCEHHCAAKACAWNRPVN